MAPSTPLPQAECHAAAFRLLIIATVGDGVIEPVPDDTIADSLEEELGRDPQLAGLLLEELFDVRSNPDDPATLCLRQPPAAVDEGADRLGHSSVVQDLADLNVILAGGVEEASIDGFRIGPALFPLRGSPEPFGLVPLQRAILGGVLPVPLPSSRSSSCRRCRRRAGALNG